MNGHSETYGPRELGAWAGAAAATVVFLIAGAVPALVYGGYCGVIVGVALNGGAPLLPGDLASHCILAGMAVGLVSAWFLFVVVGASLGALVAWLAEKTGQPHHIVRG